MHLDIFTAIRVYPVVQHSIPLGLQNVSDTFLDTCPILNTNTYFWGDYVHFTLFWLTPRSPSYLYWQCHRRFALPMAVTGESLLRSSYPAFRKIWWYVAVASVPAFAAPTRSSRSLLCSFSSFSVPPQSLWKVLRKVATWKSMPTSDIRLTRIQYQWDFSSCEPPTPFLALVYP